MKEISKKQLQEIYVTLYFPVLLVAKSVSSFTPRIDNTHGIMNISKRIGTATLHDTRHGVI